MTSLRDAAQQALEALKLSTPKTRRADDDYAEQGWKEHNAAITALRAALAEPVQEPVAWMYTGIKQDGTEHGPHLVWKPAYMDAMSSSKGAQATPLYTAPPQRPAEPAQEPAAKVELMTTGGNAGLATRIVEIDDHLRERLRPGQLLYTAPQSPQRKPLTEEEINALELPPSGTATVRDLVRLIERAHGIGGQK